MFFDESSFFYFHEILSSWTKHYQKCYVFLFKYTVFIIFGSELRELFPGKRNILTVATSSKITHQTYIFLAYLIARKVPITALSSSHFLDLLEDLSKFYHYILKLK